MAPATHTAMGYGATRTEAALTVHRVPIFCACERGDVAFDDQWIAAAVAKAKQSEREGYYPPLHIRHHEPSTDANNSVRAAGYFRILGAEPITFKGSRRIAIMADLVVTDPGVQEEVLAMRLPYRSVEIFNVEKPAIDGLALLDHEAPFLELPMLMVSNVDEQNSGGATGAAFSMEGVTDGGPMVACFRRGASAQLLFQEDNTMTAKTADEIAAEEAEAKRVQMAADEDETTEDKSEDMEGDGGIDVDSVCKAIADGSISIADMDAILAAIQGQKTEEVEEEDAGIAGPAPAAVPGAESMAANPSGMTTQMAALQGKNEALEARLDARDAAEAQAKNVSAALKRLEGRPLGAKLEERLVNFHTEHGADAFLAYVDEMASTTGVLSGANGSNAEAFAAQSGKVSAVVMKYQTEGVDAVERAAKFSAIWSDLHGRGMTRITEERYVANNMAREAASQE